MRTSFLCASSGLVHCFCLCAPSHDAHELDFHIGNLALIALVRFAEASVSSPLTMSKKTWRQDRTAAYATPTRLLRRTRAFGNRVGIREVLEGSVCDPEFHAPLMAALDTYGSAKGLGLLVQSVLSARARLHAIFNVAEVKSVVGCFPRFWRSMLDFAQDLETDVPDWLHSGVPLEMSPLLGRTVCFGNLRCQYGRDSIQIVWSGLWSTLGPIIPPQTQVT